MTRFLPALLLLLGLAVPARADVDWGMSESTLNDLSLDATNQLLLRQVARGARPAGRSRSTIAPAVGTSRVARALAARFPAADRGRAEAQFEELLVNYHAIERHFAIRRDEIAGAFAAVLVGGYMAHRNVEVSDAAFLAVVAQLRPAIAREPQLVRATAARRRELYERFAMLGSFLALASHQNRQAPPAWLAQAGASYLTELLGVEPSRVVIDDRGLSIVPPT